MFYEDIHVRIKQGLSYISFCPLRFRYNSKFILIATSLGTNAVIVTRVHCTCIVKSEGVGLLGVNIVCKIIGKIIA